MVMDIVSYVNKMQLNDQNHTAKPLSSRTLSDDMPDGVKTALDTIFGEMMNCKPSWRNAFKEKSEVIAYKKALGVAMYNAGINTMDKAMFGIAYVQTDPSPFFPSVGQFVTWCKEGYSQHLKQKELIENTKSITDQRHHLSSQTWEERQAQAKSEINNLRNMIKKT